MLKPVKNTPIKSPHGIVTLVLQLDVEYCIRVSSEGFADRYFFSSNWTNFEKDLAQEITYTDFLNFINKMDSFFIKEELT